MGLYNWLSSYSIALNETELNVFHNMEASKPKWVNSILNIIGVNSLRLGCLLINSVSPQYVTINEGNILKTSP